MRLDVPIFGILTCLAGLVVAQDDGDGDHSSGGMSSNGGATATTTSSPNSIIEVQSLPTYPVYVAGAGNQTISYSKGSAIPDLNVTAISLKRFDDNVTIAEGVMEPTSSTSTSFGAVFHSDEQAIGRRQVSTDLAEYGGNVGLPLYYEFQWENSTSKGSSYSQLIVVTTESESDIQAASEAIKKSGKDTGPAFPEEITESSSAEDPTSSTTTPTPAAATSTEVTTSNASSSSGGLSTGAIAGIAVGCSVAGLLIIAFLVWFFFFRRRGDRQRVRGTDFAADSGTHAMMPDKEAVGMSQSSPHSAFADDGGRLHDPQQRRSAAPGGGGDDATSFAPYSDRARSMSPPMAHNNDSQTDVDVANTSRSPSPPFQSRYAHLIEEGMTEDEIRRLEEEERHLDAAIEDAGRNSRMT
ncbi:hypothetical protein Hte_005149 [Hypoxylon texense]